MRLQGKSTPDAMDAHTAQATLFGHRTNTPVGRLAWGGLQCQCDHPLHRSVVNGAWSSRTRFIEQSIEAFGNKPAAPLSHTLFGQAHLFSDRRVRFGTRTQQNDPRSLRQGLRRLGPSCPLLQRSTFLGAQDQTWNRTSSSHAGSPSYATDVHGLIFIQWIKGHHTSSEYSATAEMVDIKCDFPVP